jgi:23S rRNA (cytidine1920-2'-O)/16S rRNA (cytidine1409-2'-O)-methyltransferase
VRRGLVPSRERAQADIAAGRVLVGGAPAAKPSRQVGTDEPIVVRGDPPRFVSRGGEKLAAALDRFALDVTGRRVLDAGASTGGFTDCVLQRGAAGVVAVDVGYGQLHERLRADPRVEVRDRTNVRTLQPGDIGGPVDLVVGDLSFISITLVLDALVAAGRPGADMVLLVKPQFEAGRQAVSRGRGVIGDPAVWEDVLRTVTVACGDHGLGVVGLMASPLTGAEGNVEFLLHGRTGAEGADAGALVAAALAEAGLVAARRSTGGR